MRLPRTARRCAELAAMMFSPPRHTSPPTLPQPPPHCQGQTDAIDHRLARGRLPPQMAHVEYVAHAIDPACPCARTDSSQSTTRLMPIVNSAIASAGKSGAIPPKLIACALSRTMPPQSAYGG